MQTLKEVIHHYRSTGQLDLSALETIAIAQIATDSGSTFGDVPARPALFTSPISLDPVDIGFDFESAVQWVARRARDAGAPTFHLSIIRQQTKLILVAQWPRQTCRARAETRVLVA